MGDRGCAKSSAQGASGLGWSGFVEVARSSWLPNTVLGGVSWRRAGRSWVLTAGTWIRARRSECRSPRGAQCWEVGG